MKRAESLKSDPLVPIATSVAWKLFRPKLKAALIKGELRKHDAERRSSAGRKPWDAVVIFKALVLQALYNLSDDQAEYQLRDRYSFGRFLRLGVSKMRFPTWNSLGLIVKRWRRRARWKNCLICSMGS